MKVLMVPSLSQIGGQESGIRRVIEAYTRYLPDFGIELVKPKTTSYDLRAVHAGMTGGECEVAHLHGIYFTAEYDAPEWEWHVNADIVEAIRHAKEITVPSDWVAGVFQRDIRLTPHVIPHGIEAKEWEHNEPNGGFVLWNKNRGNSDVCNPLPVYELAQRFPKGHFVSTFLPHGVPKPVNINVIGVIPHNQMKKLVQSSLVYLATVPETFGIGILEAMAAGVPVLGYACGGILDLVRHGQNGYLARPGDIDDLAEGLRYCIQHRAVLSANGRELAKAWTWQAAVSKVAEVYQRAVETGEASPLVSVTIPCHNKSATITRAIESVKRQTLNNLEAFVINDSSTDDSEVIILEAIKGDKRFRYEKVEYRNVAHVRNHGARLARGLFLSFLDGDDWIEPEFLATCVKPLQADNSLGITFCGLRWYKPDGSTGISPWPDGWDFDKQLRKQNQVPTCSVIRKECWDRLGGQRPRYSLGGAGSEDGEFYLRAGAYGWKAAKVTDQALFNYSWMSGQVTGDPNYQEVDWTFLHPWTKDGQHPFASYATPARHSHPVRAYDQPVVSVIIPVGPGHEREVINALDSLEAQTFRKWEAIVVFDTGKPPPDGLLATYPYIRWDASYKETGGTGRARNRGAEIARASFLLFLDADDWLRPLCLENMVKAWNENKAIVYTDYLGRAFIDNPDDPTLAPDIRARIYDHNEKTHETIFGKRSFDYDCERALRQPEEPDPYIWCNVTALIPKAWHDAIGGFDESMESWEDVDYHWRHARAGHCYYHLQEELMVYRFYTGTRRDRGLQKHENLVKYIREKYKGNEPMACGSCPGGRGQSVNYREASAPGAPNPFMAMPGPEMGVLKLATGGTIAVTDADLVKVKFITNNKASRRVTGPLVHDGGAIDYGYKSAGDVFLVHRLDVGGQFQPVQEQAVKLPEVEAVETPAPAALPGVEVQSLQPIQVPDTVSPHQPDWGHVTQEPEELAPVTFDPDAVLASIKSLREFVSSGGASKPMLRVLLEMEQGGKARPSAINALEVGLGLKQESHTLDALKLKRDIEIQLETDGWTVLDLAEAEPGDLIEYKGIGAIGAGKIIAQAQTLLGMHR